MPTFFCDECPFNDAGECHRHAPAPIKYVPGEGEDPESPDPYIVQWPEACSGDGCEEGAEKK